MFFFTRTAPSACPKCKRNDSWCCMISEPDYNEVTQAASVNNFSSAPIRSSFGQNLTRTRGRSRRLRYRCKNCGFEKVY